MSDDLARARARKAAGEWLARKEQEVPPPPKISLPRDGFRAFMLEAFMAGAAWSDDAFDDQRRVGQRQLDDATALMAEAATLLRGYEAHHREQASIADTGPRRDDRNERAEVNALMASRLEAWLRGEEFYPVKPGAMSAEGQAAQEAFVSAALDAGIDLVGEEDERPDDAHPGFATGGFVKTGPMLREGEIPIVLTPGNAADVMRQIGERMVDGVTIKGVDHESFDRAAAYLDQPVEVPPLVAAMTASIDEISSLPVAPAQSLVEVRRHWAEGAGFKYWPGGDGPPDDLDEDGEVMIDWGEQTESGPRFTMCGVGELTPMPGLWAETIDPESFGTIIGYHADPTLRPASKVIDFSMPIHQPRVRVEGVAEYPTPADAASEGKSPRAMIAAEPDPLAALVHARNWLISAETLIAEAAEFIRGVTGANPGSDSADLCQRLDAWLTPMATRPADEGAEKEARRSSVTHQGD